MEAELEEPYILIYEKRSQLLRSFPLEKVVKTGRPLLIISEDSKVKL